MKRLLILSALALAAGAAILRLLQHDSGYVLIVVGGKSVEMRFWFAALFILFTSAATWWLVRLLLKTFRLFGDGWSFLAGGSERMGIRRTRSGLLNFFAGDWQAALKDLLKAAKAVDQPLVQYLAAARSAYELGDRPQAEDLLKHAEEVAPASELSVPLARARLQLAENHLDSSLATLMRVKMVAPHHRALLDLLQQVYLASKDWRALEALLPDLRKYKVLRPEALAGVQAKLYVALLVDSANQSALTDRLNQLNTLWKRIPKELQQTPKIAGAYVRSLLRSEQYDQAEAVLRSTLKRTWHEDLVDLYGITLATNRQQQMRHAESWLTEHASDSALRLALGRMCLRNELWTQARDYFVAAVKLKPSPVAYAELARLQAALGEVKQSVETIQKGLLLTTHNLPDLPLPRR